MIPLRQNKLLNGQRGAVTIMFAIFLVVLLGLAALALDLGRMNLTKVQLQNAADAAALAGASSLTDPGAGTDPFNWSAAEESGLAFAQKNFANGSLIPANNVQIQTGYWNLPSSSFSPGAGTPGSGDVAAVRATIRIENLHLFFASFLGINERDLQASAVAILRETGGSGGPFDYAIFSGSTTKRLIINGSRFNMIGSVHTNNKLLINGSSITITEAAEAVATVTTNGSRINIGERLPYASVIDMPDYSEAIAEAAAAANQTYNSSYTINGSHITSDPIYVQGTNNRITVNGSGFTATGAIMGDGDITINGSGMATGDNQVCFYSKNGDITINGSNYALNGVLYAPNGNITINGSKITVNGSIVGKEVRINGSRFSVDRTNHPITSLPVDSPNIGAALVN